MRKNRKFGLIGYPLGHSFSKQYFTEKFEREGITDATYELFPLENIRMLPELLRQHSDLYGLNVTIPYKQTVIPFLNTLHESAAETGAVNVIKIENGQLTGYNSDTFGFEISLRNMFRESGYASAEVPPGEALILGNGGASKAVAAALLRMGIPFRTVSRNPKRIQEISYGDLQQVSFEKTGLIVHTTPLGTYPDTEQCVDFPFVRLGPQNIVFDLVYNPAETLFLQRAKRQGCAIKNGLEMLQLQAEKAWEFWQAT